MGGLTKWTVLVLEGHLKEPYEMSGVGSPTVGQPSSGRLHICAVTNITEILLNVTLIDQ